VAWPDDGFDIKAEIRGSLWQPKGIRSVFIKKKKKKKKKKKMLIESK
jgi:hypothetical protein